MRWGAVRAAVVVAAVTVLATSCSTPTSPAATAGSARSTVPNDVQAAVQHAVDAFNEAAGGPVPRQQAALAMLLDAGQRPVQRSCAQATTTLRFQPVYSRLAPAPGWKPTAGALTGTVYALPTLIRIYSGNRIIGTDLTDLHLAVQNGRARLPALCLS